MLPLLMSNLIIVFVIIYILVYTKIMPIYIFFATKK